MSNVLSTHIQRLTKLAVISLLMITVGGLSTICTNALADTDRWGPGIIKGKSVDFGYQPCANREVRSCLTELGLSEEAVEFSLAFDPQSPRESYAIEFMELGKVDLAMVSVPYSPYEERVLINGTPDLIRIDSVFRNLPSAFPDNASQAVLRRYPDAAATWVGISGHRFLPSGGQRFVIGLALSTGCRACPIVGSGVSFLDFDADGREITRSNIGLRDNSQEDIRGQVAWTQESLTGSPIKLQARLNVLGYDAGPMDGVFSQKTQEALAEFQTEQCLPPTGSLDEATIKKLVEVDAFSAPCARTADSATPQFVAFTIDKPEETQFSTLKLKQGQGWSTLMTVVGKERANAQTNYTLNGNTRFGKDTCYYGAITAGFTGTSQKFTTLSINGLAVGITKLSLGNLTTGLDVGDTLIKFGIDIGSAYLKEDDVDLAVARSVIERTMGYIAPKMADHYISGMPYLVSWPVVQLSEESVTKLLEDEGIVAGATIGTNENNLDNFPGAPLTTAKIEWYYSPTTHYLSAYISAQCEPDKKGFYVIRYQVEKGIVSIGRVPIDDTIEVLRLGPK